MLKLKNVSYRRDNARRRSLGCSTSFKVIDLMMEPIESPYGT